MSALEPGTRYWYPDRGPLTIGTTAAGWTEYTWDDPEMGTCKLRTPKLLAVLEKNCTREEAGNA